MFQFPPFALSRLYIHLAMTRHDPCRVSPFGHLRVLAYVQLTGAYRSLSRPSSPPDAKRGLISKQ